MSAPRGIVDVVVRCRDEMPHVSRALDALLRQEGLDTQVTFIDCGSSDGSRQVAVDRGAKVIDHEPAYVPGQVLNLGMESTTSPVVIFCNADAVPCAPETLRDLVEPFEGVPQLAATYGRQVPRPDALAHTRADHARAFGERDSLRTRRGFFFSMAASAIRRKVWQGLPFDEGLQYSEDVDWVHRAAALGWTTRYVASSVFEKSREYDLRGHFQRRAGEGAADTSIFRLGSRPSLLSEFLKPLSGAIVRDTRAGILSPRGLAVRTAQAAGYFVGRGRGGC